MKLILKCTSPECSPDDIEWAFVTLDAPLLERALARSRIFLQSRAQHEQLYEMYWWDNTPDFFSLYLDPDTDHPSMRTSPSKTPCATTWASRLIGETPISTASATRPPSPMPIFAP